MSSKKIPHIAGLICAPGWSAWTEIVMGAGVAERPCANNANPTVIEKIGNLVLIFLVPSGLFHSGYGSCLLPGQLGFLGDFEIGTDHFRPAVGGPTQGEQRQR